MHLRSALRRRRAVVVAAIVGIVVAGTALSGCDERAPALRTIDPAAPPTAALPTTSSPDPVASREPDSIPDTPAAWVLDVEKRSVARVDPATDNVVMVTSATVRPSSFALAPDAAWVASYADGRIVRVPRDGSPAARAPTFEGERPKWVAADTEGVWVAGLRRDGRVVRYDPVRQRYTGAVVTGAQVGGLAVGPDGTLYVVQPDARRVVRVDRSTSTVSATSGELSGEPGSIAVDAGGVWIAGPGTVTRLDPVSLQSVATVPVGSRTAGFIAVGGGFVWYTDPVDGRVSRIDPKTNAVAGVEVDADDPGPIAFGAGSLWIVTDSGLKLSRLSAGDGSLQARIRSKVRLSSVLFG